MQINDDTICVVSFPEVSIYDFYKTREEAEAAIPVIKASDLKDAEQYERNALEYEHRVPGYWKGQAEKYRNRTQRVMTLKEFEQAESDKYLSMPLERISKEKWYEMLEVLPPVKWGHRDGFESFFMSEFMTGTYTNQYAKNELGYFQKIVDIKRPETWIKLAMIESAVS